MTALRTRRFAAALALLIAGCDRNEPGAATETPSASIGSPAVSAPPEARAPSTSAAPSSGSPGVSPNPAAPPKGFVRVRVGGVTAAGQGNAVLLVDDERQRALVVFIGETEALSIQLRLDGTRYKRPLTHDLVDTMLDHLGARVLSVRVDRLEDDIYYGVVVLRSGNRVHEFDSRTSDGIALALGSDAPLFVARDVLDRAAIPLDDDGAPRFDAPPEPRERPAIAL